MKNPMPSLQLVKPGLKGAPVSDCSRCSDTGFEAVEREGHTYRTRCVCRLKRIRQERLGRIPPRYRDATVASFEPRCAGGEKAKRMLEADPAASLMLVGPPGVGKTHLCYAQYRAQVEAGMPAVDMVTDTQLARLARQAIEDSTARLGLQAEALEDRESYHLLVDDLGKRRLTAFQREDLWDVVNTLYSRKLGLTVTTQLRDDELAEWMDGAGDQYLGIGVSFVRRLGEACEVVELTA